MRVVIDTNVLIAALTKPRGSAGRVVRAWREGEIEVVTSDATVKEAELVINATWLARLSSQREVEMLLAELRTRAVRVRGRAVSNIRLKDQGDLRLVEAALAGDADYLVTADRELLLQQGYGSTRFVTPAELLKTMRGDGVIEG